MSTTLDRTWAVFSKPWAELAAAPLAALVGRLGFNAVELPVRPGAFVTPEHAEDRLPEFAKTLRGLGIEPISIASDPTPAVLDACAAAGVPMIRIMAPIGDDGYRASVRRLRGDLERLAPECERTGIRIGIQPHHGAFVSTVLGVCELIRDLPPEFCLIWDAGHDALAGEDPAYTLEQCGDRLGLVNLKNAVHRPIDDQQPARFRTWFGPGDQGLADWPEIIDLLRTINYDGPVCLTAQYTDTTPDEAADLAAADLAWARTL
ncbi:sugar phosphate isomerase/epimerase family protein [Microlunatus elymi]|uniref:sugar phosphate isomerase/epimerase family protein n=1 Tax=Microlunatus elymi TaxID=2596828 RepID=UPI001AEFA75E|nr:sugar phosphate isomerase/epimerase [Microlunatus elymi]